MRYALDAAGGVAVVLHVLLLSACVMPLLGTCVVALFTHV